MSCLAARPHSCAPQDDFWAIDRDANILWGHEALKAGVQHLVLVATFEGRDSRSVSEFSAAKEEAVDILQQECTATGAKFTVIRPNAYFKDLTDMAFDGVLAYNRHIVLGSGLHRINPVAREDVARFMVDCIQQRRHGEFPVGGPDIFTFAEIGALAAQIIHGTTNNIHSIRVLCIPLWTLRLHAGVLDTLGRVSRSARRQAAFLHWMVYCSTHDAIAPCRGTLSLQDHYKQKLAAIKYKQSLRNNPHDDRNMTALWRKPSFGLSLTALVLLAAAMIWQLFYSRQN